MADHEYATQESTEVPLTITRQDGTVEQRTARIVHAPGAPVPERMDHTCGPDCPQCTVTGCLTHGATVYDEATGRYGTVADTTLSPDWVHLRPIGGGLEWKARRENIRPATTSELLADRLRTERTTTGRPM